MKIIQITPGNIPIPPNGWGAVEKVIWEYKMVLESLGYQTEIRYANEVENLPDQIVHVHMANLALLLNQRGIPYVFSMHDHHVEHFGKDSSWYKDNYEAIKNAKLAFLHSKHLIPYFDNMPNIVYLPHGVNLNDYKFTDRSERVRQRPHRLFMMANNGLAGDPLVDRKGFLLGIEAAKRLGLEIGIVCPRKRNEEFFQHHNVEYDKLEIFYDMDYLGSIDKMSEYDIFLHPSNLEAGHPNLTLVEAISMGIPVVGVMDKNTELKGMIKVDRDVGELVKGIQKAINTYDTQVQLCENYRTDISWNMVVSKMVQEYKLAYDIREKDQLLNTYINIKPTHQEKKTGDRGYKAEFKQGSAFLKGSVFNEKSTIHFVDQKTSRTYYISNAGKEPSFWAKINTPYDQYIDWKIQVKQGIRILFEKKIELQGKRILVTPTTVLDNGLLDYVKKFQKTTGCFTTIRYEHNFEDGICFDPNADPEEFYLTLNELQVMDYFKQKPTIPERYVFECSCSALGDTIGFLPYAQKWAQLNNKKVDTFVKFPQIFDQKEYPNLNLRGHDENYNLYEYSHIYKFDYMYNKPLMEGFSYQFELEYEETQAKLKNIEGDRPIKEKYVCIGVHSTAQCKYWNYPKGWDILCRKIRDMGMIPVSLDMYQTFGIDGHWNNIPNSAIKKIGMSLEEILLYLKHCEFFIGISSGLSWMAWGLGKKVVMISGTTSIDNEFKKNNIRINNPDVCNGCFTKTLKYQFNPGDWLWCPEHRGTSKHFECTSTISPKKIIDEIKNNNLI